MEIVVLRNVEFEKNLIRKVPVYLDDSGNVIVLTFLWLLNLSTTMEVYSWRRRAKFNSGSKFIYPYQPKKITQEFSSNDVSENTIANYTYHFFRFVKYINQIHKQKNTPSVHNLEKVNCRLVNFYLNSVLPNSVKSVSALKAHQSSIHSFFNFLYAFDLTEPIFSRIYPKTKKLINMEFPPNLKTSYISRSDRFNLLSSCRFDRDRLIIRVGYELGLRASENKGLILNDQKLNSVTKKGLVSLFNELDKTEAHEFEYTLSGKYAKGGKSRLLYIDRDLLVSMKKYVENERSNYANNDIKNEIFLFIRYDVHGRGLPINNWHPSKLFRKTIKKCKDVNQSLTYHDLRHTFATELYHNELIDNKGMETRSESAALMTVAQRLGHSHGSKVTQRYIRLRQNMLHIEKHMNA